MIMYITLTIGLVDDASEVLIPECNHQCLFWVFPYIDWHAS